MPRFNVDEYVDVQTRIVRFWEEYPDGAIRTRLMSPPDDFSQCRYEAAIHKHRDGPADATGYAFEIATVGTRGPNDTSHEENCETSAIGRALANMGYATKREDRPSRQEMQKVDRMGGNVSSPPPTPQRPAQRADQRIAGVNQPATPRQLKFIQAMARESGLSDDAVKEEIERVYGCTVADLSRRDASAYIERLNLRKGISVPSDGAAATPDQPAPEPNARTPGGASIKSLNLSLVLSEELGISDADVHRWTAEQFEKASRKDLDQRQMSKLIDWLKSLQAAGAAKPAQPAQMTALSDDTEESGEIVDWTRFWVIARADGYQGKDDLKKRLGFDISGMTPQQALEALRQVTEQPA